MPTQPLRITLSEGDLEDLEKLANRPSTPQQIARRAQIVLLNTLIKSWLILSNGLLRVSFWLYNPT